MPTTIKTACLKLCFCYTNLNEGFDHLYVVLLHPPHYHLIQLQPHHS